MGHVRPPRHARATVAVAAVLALAGTVAACGGSPATPGRAPQPSASATPGADQGAATAHVGPSAGATAAAGNASTTNGRIAPQPAPTAAPPRSAGAAGQTRGSSTQPGPSEAGAPPAASGDANAAGAQTAIVAAVTPDVSVPRNEAVTPIPTPTATPVSGGSPTLGGCPMFPANNPWNQNISAMPVDPNSATYISNIGGGNLHADFGGGGAYGIPYIIVPQSQPMTAINFTDYGDESDPGPYPVPLNAPVEGGASSSGDRHVLALQQGTCKLFEMFSAYPQADHWDAGSGAVFNLNSNALRPQTWTSADAAGLPILPGLVRYDEVQAGAIRHAVRFTVNTVRKAWVDPATHYGTSTDPARIPYGAKLRLKASFDVSSYHGEARVILDALKTYGMIVADQGTSWYITGAADPRWDDNDLNQLKTVPGSAFEVVQLGTIHTYP